MKYDYEVLIVGGGPAGLSAAMTLGRIGRSAIICDDDRPRNAPSSHVNNLPGNDGIHPAEWRKKVHSDLEKYKSISFFKGNVSSVIKNDSGFAAQLSGKIIHVKKVILAYGIRDQLPELEGFRELWGKSLFHCAFCHGYEIRSQRLGLIANGEMANHFAPLIFSLSKDLVLFTNGKPEISPVMNELLLKNKVQVREEKIIKLNRKNEKLVSLSLEDHQDFERDALFIAPVFPLRLKSSLGEVLGCEKTEMGLYKAGERGQTSVPGVFAAGECVQMSSVLGSSSSGMFAGTGVVFELINEDFKMA